MFLTVYSQSPARSTKLGLIVGLTDRKEDDISADHTETYIFDSLIPLIENSLVGKLALDFYEALAARLYVSIYAHSFVVFELDHILIN